MPSGCHAEHTRTPPCHPPDFLTHSTAQLRNPLHAMSGALTAIESGGMSESEVRKEMKWMRHGMNVMSEITDDVLDIRALSSGKLKLRRAWTNLHELLDG